MHMYATTYINATHEWTTTMHRKYYQQIHNQLSVGHWWNSVINSNFANEQHLRICNQIFERYVYIHIKGGSFYGTVRSHFKNLV